MTQATRAYIEQYVDGKIKNLHAEALADSLSFAVFEPYRKKASMPPTSAKTAPQTVAQDMMRMRGGLDQALAGGQKTLETASQMRAKVHHLHHKGLQPYRGAGGTELHDCAARLKTILDKGGVIGEKHPIRESLFNLQHRFQEQMSHLEEERKIWSEVASLLQEKIQHERQKPYVNTVYVQQLEAQYRQVQQHQQALPISLKKMDDRLKIIIALEAQINKSSVSATPPSSKVAKALQDLTQDLSKMQEAVKHLMTPPQQRMKDILQAERRGNVPTQPEQVESQLPPTKPR
jgi:hypothetical protein